MDHDKIFGVLGVILAIILGFVVYIGAELVDYFLYGDYVDQVGTYDYIHEAPSEE